MKSDYKKLFNLACEELSVMPYCPEEEYSPNKCSEKKVNLKKCTDCWRKALIERECKE